MGRCKKVLTFDFQSQFSKSKIIRNFLNFFFIENMNLGAHFLLLTFIDNINFYITLFSKMIFDSTPFSKFNNFIWLQLIFSQKFSDFVSPLENSTTGIAIVYTHLITNLLNNIELTWDLIFAPAVIGRLRFLAFSTKFSGNNFRINSELELCINSIRSS